MNIKSKISKLVSGLLCFSMIFSNVLPAYAADAVITENTLDGEDLSVNERNLEDITVTYKQASSFFVTIPKTIVLDGWKQSTYAVKVSGDIDAEQCVYVAPVDGIADTENIDFYMKDQASENAKDDVVASVTHNKFHWSSAEVTEGYRQDDNLVSAPDLTAGAWRGIFQMEIKLETHVTHKHNYVETITKQPTCTEKGEKTYTCDCGDSYTEEIPATGHKDTDSDGICDECGGNDPNHKHSYTEKITKEPTCTEAGEKTYTCKCGDSYTEVLPAKGHHYENGECTECGEKDPNHVHSYSEMITKEPTCTEAGEKTYICGCGDSYTETIPAKGHNYVDGECTGCGEADPDYVYPIGTQANAEEWNYTLDDENNIITLNYYISKTVYNVTVYGSYEVDGKIYETRIKSNTNNVVNYYMFSSSCSQYVKTVHFNDDVDTSDVTNMHGMFYSAQALTDIYFGDGFDTSNVTDMAYMFYRCEKLESLDLSKFNTSNVTDMNHMFYGCGAVLQIYTLDNLDLSNFDTSNVTNMNGMFASCGAININLGNNFDVSKVTNMSSMFQNCARLNSLDLSDFNAINVTKMDYMFSGCTNLVSLDLSNFKTSKVTTMIYMFNNCKKLTNLDLSSLTTENVTDMNNMFCNCSSLTDVNLSSFNTAKVQYMNNMFENCSALITLDLSSFDISKTSYFTKMFYKCSQLKTIYATKDKWNIKYGATTTNMFASCGTSKVTYK